jgi:hypothetical protein
MEDAMALVKKQFAIAISGVTRGGERIVAAAGWSWHTDEHAAMAEAHDMAKARYPDEQYEMRIANVTATGIEQVYTNAGLYVATIGN